MVVMWRLELRIFVVEGREALIKPCFCYNENVGFIFL